MDVAPTTTFNNSYKTSCRRAWPKIGGKLGQAGPFPPPPDPPGKNRISLRSDDSLTEFGRASPLARWPQAKPSERERSGMGKSKPHAIPHRSTCCYPMPPDLAYTTPGTKPVP
jgi:hypothetical protein